MNVNRNIIPQFNHARRTLGLVIGVSTYDLLPSLPNLATSSQESCLLVAKNPAYGSSVQITSIRLIRTLKESIALIWSDGVLRVFMSGHRGREKSAKVKVTARNVFCIVTILYPL